MNGINNLPSRSASNGRADQQREEKFTPTLFLRFETTSSRSPILPPPGRPPRPVAGSSSTNAFSISQGASVAVTLRPSGTCAAWRRIGPAESRRRSPGRWRRSDRPPSCWRSPGGRAECSLRASVPDKESRSSPVTQQLVLPAGPKLKMWVIESRRGPLSSARPFFRVRRLGPSAAGRRRGRR